MSWNFVGKWLIIKVALPQRIEVVFKSVCVKGQTVLLFESNMLKIVVNKFGCPQDVSLWSCQTIDFPILPTDLSSSSR